MVGSPYELNVEKTEDSELVIPLPTEYVIDHSISAGDTLYCRFREPFSQRRRSSRSSPSNEYRNETSSRSSLTEVVKCSESTDTSENGEQPVSEGEILSVEITSEGKEGDGVAFIDGFVVFVPDVAVGNVVQVRINTVEKNHARATTVE